MRPSKPHVFIVPISLSYTCEVGAFLVTRDQYMVVDVPKYVLVVYHLLTNNMHIIVTYIVIVSKPQHVSVL